MVTRRDDKQLSDLRCCVAKVRRTINGNLLHEVAKGLKGFICSAAGKETRHTAGS